MCKLYYCFVVVVCNIMLCELGVLLDVLFDTS